MEIQSMNKRDRAKLEATQMKILRKIMKSQAMITKESNDDFRQRLNISTIDSEIQVRRISILHRAANNPEQSKQLKIALLGTRHDMPNHTKHRKQGLHATIAHDLLQLIPPDPHLQYIRNQLAGEGVSDRAWQYLANLNKSTTPSSGPQNRRNNAHRFQGGRQRSPAQYAGQQRKATQD
jgi:hypothetical protein